MRAKTPVDVGLILRERRRALGLDQAALAERIGVSRQWLVEVEGGKARAEMGLVLRAFTALGLTLDVQGPDSRSQTTAPVTKRSAPATAKKAARRAASAVTPRAGEMDIDAVIERARGRK
jgi:y4mF family transcriptional regulator